MFFTHLNIFYHLRAAVKKKKKNGCTKKNINDSKKKMILEKIYSYQL